MAFLEEYTLLKELGKGGFATVYKVRHNELGYIRAVRVLNDPIKSKDDDLYGKFLKECRILLRLGNGNHSAIVHIYKPDLLYDSFNNNYKAVVEMDYVDGSDLLHYLADNNYFLPADEVIRMVEEMSSALAYCHEDIYNFCKDRDADKLEPDPMDGSKLLIDNTTRQSLIDKYKVIHNDIHSRNIMRRENGDFVLLDFGLAIEGDEVGVSSSRRNAGALEYISPEKWDDSNVLTTQSDIYSFGVVMYEYLTGRVPFKMEKNSYTAQPKLLEKVMSHLIPSIFEMRKASYEAKYHDKSYGKDYPDWLEEAILKCLEKEPDKRFRNGKELYDFVHNHIEEDRLSAAVNKDLEKERDTLKNGNENLIRQIAEFAIKNKELDSRIKSLTDELSSVNALCNMLRNENEKLQGKNTDSKWKAFCIVLMLLLLLCGGCLWYSIGGRTPKTNEEYVNANVVDSLRRDYEHNLDSLMRESDSIASYYAKWDLENKALRTENDSLLGNCKVLFDKCEEYKSASTYKGHSAKYWHDNSLFNGKNAEYWYRKFMGYDKK